MVTRGDRHLEAGQVRRPAADGEHDALVWRQVMRSLRHEQSGLAHPLWLELLDDHLVEQGAQDVGHQLEELFGMIEIFPEVSSTAQAISSIEPSCDIRASSASSSGAIRA